MNMTPFRQSLLDVLEKNGPMDRDALEKNLNRPRTTIHSNLVVLLTNKLVIREELNLHTRGRQKVYFFLAKDEAKYVTKIRKPGKKTERIFHRDDR